MFQNSTIPILEQVVNFAQTRHQLLASNIANIEVPGYQVRDLSVENFQEALKEAIEARNQQNAPVTSRLLNSDAGNPLQEVKESIKSILFHDGSDVAIEQQVAELSKNQMMHSLALNIMRHQMTMLETAIRERI